MTGKLVESSLLERLGLKHALHEFYYCNKGRFMSMGVKYRFY